MAICSLVETTYHLVVFWWVFTFEDIQSIEFRGVTWKLIFVLSFQNVCFKHALNYMLWIIHDFLFWKCIKKPIFHIAWNPCKTRFLTFINSNLEIVLLPKDFINLRFILLFFCLWSSICFILYWTFEWITIIWRPDLNSDCSIFIGINLVLFNVSF